MMNEKNDLMQDISGGNGNNNLRKYLILGGGVFVLFVVGIVISKFMFSSPKKDNNTQVILPADMKTEATKDTKLFNDIPIENEATNTNENSFKKPVESKEKVEENNQVPISNTNTQPQKEEAKPKKVEQITPKIEVKQPQKVVQHQIKTQPKKEIKTTTIKKGYYIQVAAVTRGNPSPKFLKLITKNGFNYKIMQIDVKGLKVKRVLVGPFNYKEVKQALPKVKRTISSSAFIKRLK